MTPAFLRYATSQGPHGLADVVHVQPAPTATSREIIAGVKPELLQILARAHDGKINAANLQDALAATDRRGVTEQSFARILRRLTGGLSQLPHDLFMPQIELAGEGFRREPYYEAFAARWAARLEAERPQNLNAVPAFWKTGERLDARQAEVLDDIDDLVEKTDRPVVIFDLDECLFASKMREWQIWQEFAKSDDCTDATLRAKLKQLKPEHIDSWDLSHVMVANLGLDEALFAANHQVMRDFHAKRFFGNEHLKYDTPLPGAALFVGGLHARGAHVVYLTGRSEERMRTGTIGALLAGGFPIDPIDWRTTLLMKPDSANIQKISGEPEQARITRQRDAVAEFKKRAYVDIAALGSVVASFDNDAANVNGLYRRFHTDVGFAVRVNTMVPRAENDEPGVFVIDGFVR